MGILEIEKLSFSYPESKTPVLKEISLSVEEGEFLVLCGTSGCGKSTLLRQLKPMLAPFGKRTGEIRFEGENVWELDERTQSSSIGYVLQNPDQQIVTEKVWHELAFALESLGETQQTIRLRVAEMASYFGIEELFHKRTDELSGGQKQLLNLASVMTVNPRVLLLDEPTSQLDPIVAANFLATVKKINQELGVTVILTEHRMNELFGMADRIAVMDNGTIRVCGTPKDVAKWIVEERHELYGALPAPAQIYMEMTGGNDSPLDVKEGRKWFRTYTHRASHYAIRHFTRDKERNAGMTQDSEKVSDRKLKTPGETIMECREVWFRYERESQDILKDFCFSVRKGELYCLLGGNGTGKSTALTVLSGLYRPYRGKILIKGKDIKKYSSGELYRGLLGVVPQNPQCLFIKSTVREELQEMTAKDPEAVSEMAKLMHLEKLLEQHPYDLSGGEQQRLALAKILLLEPEILLLDEPTKGLDCCRKKELAEILAKLNARGITVIMVSHDIEFCAEYGDQCGMLFDGKIISQGTAVEFFAGNNFYTTAANRMVRQVYPKALTTQDVITKMHSREAGR